MAESEGMSIFSRFHPVVKNIEKKISKLGIEISYSSNLVSFTGDASSTIQAEKLVVDYLRKQLDATFFVGVTIGSDTGLYSTINKLQSSFLDSNSEGNEYCVTDPNFCLLPLCIYGPTQLQQAMDSMTKLQISSFDLPLTSIRKLGPYKIAMFPNRDDNFKNLQEIHSGVRSQFAKHSLLQDKVCFNPHVTFIKATYKCAMRPNLPSRKAVGKTLQKIEMRLAQFGEFEDVQLSLNSLSLLEITEERKLKLHKTTQAR